MEILIMQGPPYSGLATINAKICELHNYHFLNIGDEIRSEVSNGTLMGQRILAYSNKGEVVPAQLLQEMLETVVNKIVDKGGILIVGYPRSSHHAELLLDFLLRNPKNSIKACFLFTPKEIIIARLKSSHHWEDSDEELDSRIMERLNNSEREVNEIKTYLESRIEVITVDGVGTIAEVLTRVLAAI